MLERAVLRLVGDVSGLLEIEDFRDGLLGALRAAVPAEWASLNEVELDGSSLSVVAEPSMEERWRAPWEKFGLQNPILRYFARTRDGRPLRFSDVVSVEGLHALELYREVYGPLGVEHQIAFTLPARSGVILGIALSRGEHDFTDAERDLLTLARPHLIQAYNNARSYSSVLQANGGQAPTSVLPSIEALRALGLTTREAEVLALAAGERANGEIARSLTISPRTVEKHLQHCYAKLGVRDRSQAKALLSGPQGPPSASA